MTEQIQDENTQISERRAKLAELRKQNKVAFPNTFKRDTLAVFIHDHFADKSKEDLSSETHEYALAGRIMLKRVMGKASFITIQDMSGRIQAYLRQDELSDVYESFKHWDLGDIVGVKGRVFRTNAGELSIHATQLQLLTKAIRPLPDKFHGLSDQELRYRKRYVDLMMNIDTRRVFMVRSKIIEGIREFLSQRGYLEVETPMMHILPGGAAAKPFATHHHALDLPMYLRIAPELYLKRLVVGGFEKVFEINRNFRNEGLSTRHNPEFTMLEFYEAYSDYKDLIQLTEDLLHGLAQKILGTTKINYQGEVYDLNQPFQKMTVLEAITHYAPEIKKADLEDLKSASAIAKKLGIEIPKHAGLGKVQIELFEKIAEHRLMAPTFITEYPAEVSPLARRNEDNPFITDRFEFFIAGRELANGFSELNDAEDQAERFRAQVDAKKSGDDEAMFYDADYVEALEYGLPPTAGEGIGIDRLVMFFTDSPSIRDVILFPHMRPEK
jgi:lysyl-tRNA synthetase, class II